MKVNCGFCMKEIVVPMWKYKKLIDGETKNLFCDRKCLANWQSREFSKFVELICFNCNTIFTVRNANKNQKFCSYHCASENRKIDKIVICDYCNKSFSKKPAQVKEHNFCTKTCSAKWSSVHNNKKLEMKCCICQEIYRIKQSQSEKSKCCSKKCLNVWKRKIYPNTEEGKRNLLIKGINSMKNKKYSDTKPEKIVREYLENEGILFESQLNMYDKFIVDFYLPDQNVVIEVLGDYWHGNPRKYGSSDEGLIPLTKRQLKQQGKDRARYSYLTTCGHSVHMIWECDIYKDVEKELFFLKHKI